VAVRPAVLISAAHAEVCGGLGGWVRWAKLAGAVGSSSVVVANVFREHGTQVPLVDDQHAVGEFGSEGADEPFGEAVRSRGNAEVSGPRGCPHRRGRGRRMR
jgi:hypothetical protein